MSLTKWCWHPTFRKLCPSPSSGVMWWVSFRHILSREGEIEKGTYQANDLVREYVGIIRYLSNARYSGCSWTNLCCFHAVTHPNTNHAVLNVFILESELPADPARTAERRMCGVRRLRTGHSTHHPWWWRRRQSPKLCVLTPHWCPPYCEGWDYPLLGEPPVLTAGFWLGSRQHLPAAGTSR